MQSVIERIAAAARFSIPSLIRELLPQLQADEMRRSELRSIENALGPRLFKYVLAGLLRTSFLIEVDVGGDGTKYDCRWGARLAAADPRRASFSDCEAIFWKLTTELSAAIANPERVELLQKLEEANSLPYELPVDYLERRWAQMHHESNVAWVWDRPDVRSAVLLRHDVRDATKIGAEADAIKAILNGKVSVKTYLTDRALTGEYKTNREKRWEAHPKSHQFAYRADCILIEKSLTEGIMFMYDFPPEIRGRLGLPEAPSEHTRCPITFDLLSYRALVTEVLDPAHGRSKFQVGHLYPLKATGDGGSSGHTPANIGWVSEDGNRIQGHLGLSDVRALLARISKNYETAGQSLIANQPTRVT